MQFTLPNLGKIFQSVLLSPTDLQEAHSFCSDLTEELRFDFDFEEPERFYTRHLKLTKPMTDLLLFTNQFYIYL